MIKKLYEKNETLFCILLIVLYVVVNSYCMKNFGSTNYMCAIVNTIFSVMLIVLIVCLKKTKYYGLVKVKDAKKYLFFIPLVIISSVNL